MAGLKWIQGITREELQESVDPWDILVALDRCIEATKEGVRRDAVISTSIHITSAVCKKPVSLESTPEC